MKKNARLFGGIEAKLFDTRKFKVKTNDLSEICENFKLGKLISSVKEPNIRVSHSNFIIFIETDKGKYILKFFPTLSPKNIIKEFTLNKFAINHNFPVPYMYNSKKNTPFVKIPGYLATCYSFIDGEPLYLKKLDSLKIKKINTGIFQLNQLLIIFMKTPSLHSFLNSENFHKKIDLILNSSEGIGDYPQREFVNSIIRGLSTAYIDCQKDFIKKPLHPNITLANMLLNNNRIFFLDFSHIRIDYQLYDLAALITSCRLFNHSDKTITEITKGYFKNHNIKKGKNKILNFLITINLLKEYLKTIKKEKNVSSSGKYSRYLALYKSTVERHKNRLMDLIKKYHQ